MKSGDQKNRVTPIFLIIFLLTVNLLTSCSGCSKSGRKIPADNDTIDIKNEKLTQSDTGKTLCDTLWISV